MDWGGALWRALPPSTTYEELPTGHADEQSLRHAMAEIGALGPDGKGVSPLSRFAHQLSQIEGLNVSLKEKLESWLRTECPEPQRGLLSQPHPDGDQAEPRIVVRMTPQPDAGGTAGEEQFRYDVWFLGFPTPPTPQVHVGPRSGFKRVLETAWSAVGGQVDPEFVWVELFLPKQLFSSWAVEQERSSHPAV